LAYSVIQSLPARRADALAKRAGWQGVTRNPVVKQTSEVLWDPSPSTSLPAGRQAQGQDDNLWPNRLILFTY
jgi:hypothetical protein